MIYYTKYFIRKINMGTSTPCLPDRQALSVTLLLMFFFSTLTSYGCECPLTQLGKAECNKYDIIFRGKVDSVITCKNKPGIAFFEVHDLYKGNLTKHFKVTFDCNDPCASEFKVGEEWIIYSNYKQIDNALMDWCSRSRRYIKNSKEDFYAVTYGNSYDDEVKFLLDSLGLHRFLKDNVVNPGQRNILPTTNQTILILICSILCILLFYYLFNKFFK